MRTTIAFVGLAVFAGVRSARRVTAGILATDNSPLVDTAAQGGLVFVAMTLVYFFLRRSDQRDTVQTSRDVAERDAEIAELKGRLTAEVEARKVAETGERAMRVDWMHTNETLVGVQAELISVQKELAAAKDRESALHALGRAKDIDH